MSADRSLPWHRKILLLCRSGRKTNGGPVDLLRAVYSTSVANRFVSHVGPIRMVW